ncbi:enterochelin esterase-like enzyme [Allocatelliglobosispora scoriae]|uniref:Enterochelin esterase-like enzyme n=1 Tax=Allocatelliglobosispora scoriae TaxID=643052 RepID=A0A841BUR6_9ACTN|nr:alpha/beta hydrolase-fold protein [Allocatelliglobosispora scoriae]MBB5870899.1 enterochelin esterase-like enzyme [Allocatelliglobosispora scoriae]
MDEVWKLSLVTGWLPAALTILGVAAFIALIAIPPYPRRWAIIAPVVIVSAGVIVYAGSWAVTNVAKLFTDEIPTENLLWSWVALAGLGLAVGRLPRLRWWGWIAAALAAILVFIGAGAQINRFYGQYPTLGTALGVTRSKTVELSSVDKPATGVVTPPPGGFLADVWQPPATMPTKGTVSKVTIPGTRSGFKARSAYVYLPPAYQVTAHRPLLPVLVLVAGQPGQPESWLISGQLVDKLDAFAAAHKGLAPVVVIPDDLGSSFANPLCLDSKLGNAQTYLAKDVPDWINSELQVAQGRDNWTFAGFSHGGTCALQMGVNAPDVYGSFIDISGQSEPTLGSREKTIDGAFGGDAAAFAKVNPLDVMKTRQFPDTAAVIVGGTSDGTYLPQAKEVYAACKAAGMDVTYMEIDGGHDWRVWGGGLEQNLPWLARQTHLSSQ